MEDICAHLEVAGPAWHPLAPCIFELRPVDSAVLRHVVHAESDADETCLVWLLYFTDDLVNVELDPTNLARVRVKELSNVATVVADILEATNLILASKIDKHTANILTIDIRSRELCVLWLCSEVEPIVRAFREHGLACCNLLVGDAHDDLVLLVLFGQSDGGVDLGHESEGAVDTVLLGSFDVLLWNLLHLEDRLLSLDGVNLHEQATLPE